MASDNLVGCGKPDRQGEQTRNAAMIAGMKKGRPRGTAFPVDKGLARSDLALTGLVAGLRLVDDVDPALAAHDPAIPVAQLERAERVGNLHGVLLFFAALCSVRLLFRFSPATRRTTQISWWAVQGSNL